MQFINAEYFTRRKRLYLSLSQFYIMNILRH